MKKNNKKKETPGNEKLKTELKQISTDLKKLKKSKKRMQLLWYRTKKEHVALIKDVDQRLKALKKRTAKKTTRAKKSIMKPMRKKARERKQIKKEIIKKTRKNAAPGRRNRF